MDGRVLVPWEQNKDNAPGALTVEVYDGRAEPLINLDDVVFYVMPYNQDQEDVVGLMRRMPRLRAVQLLTAGYEHVLSDLPDGTRLYNGRGLHDASTAEHALGLILAAQRDLPQWADDQRRRVWNPHYTRSLADSRVLIVGYGNIGEAIEKRLLPFETEVVRVARRARPASGVHGVGELRDLLPDVDIVVVVTPHTPETEGLIGAAELALLRDGALIVNVGRGPVLDTAALLAEKGRIRAALDVTDPEPLPADHPLWGAPGVYLTPHVAGGSDAFYPRARRFIDEQLRRWAAGEPLVNRVALDASP